MVFSLLYQIFKFDILKGQTIVIAQNEDFALKIKIFLDRANITQKVKSITKGNPLDYKNY